MSLDSEKRRTFVNTKKIVELAGSKGGLVLLLAPWAITKDVIEALAGIVKISFLWPQANQMIITGKKINDEDKKLSE